MQPESLGPNENDITPPARHVKPWRRRSIIIPTVALTAMAGAGIGLATSSSHEPYAGKPTATYSAPEIPGQPHYYSATETFNTLAQDPNISKNEDSIDISPIAEQFKPTDYAMISSTDPHTKKQDTLSLVPSVPVMEVRFDKATSQFTYQVQTSKGLNNQELYQLLLPVMQNSVLLRTAFETIMLPESPFFFSLLFLVDPPRLYF